MLLKLGYHPGIGDGLDGAYYFHIARHVANGDGLVTNLSIFHMGLDPLPQPATTYPLLPLLLGWIGRIFDIERAAELLPEGLYLASLLLVFLMVRIGVLRSRRRAPRWVALAIAFSVAVWFGLNPIYYWATSRPYTESLGFVCALSTLLAYGAARTKLWSSAWTRGYGYAAIGLLAGLCYLARFQLLVVLVALCFSRLVGRDRRRFRDVACLVLGALPPLVWLGARVLSLPNAEPLILFDYAKYQQLGSLPPLSYVVPCETTLACVGDKLDGLLVAFDPWSEHSYLAQFGVIAWAAPLGTAFLVHQILKRRSPLDSWARPRHAIWVASAFVGLLAVVPIHLVHAEYGRPWAFSWRQGLPLIFVLLPVALWLFFRAKAVGRLIVMTAFVLSMSSSLTKTLSVQERVSRQGWLDVRAQAGAYLQRVAMNSRTLALHSQTLSAFTDAPLYWLACWSPPELPEMLVRERGIERIVLAPRDLSCPSVASLRPRLELERSFSNAAELRVFRIKPNQYASRNDAQPSPPPAGTDDPLQKRTHTNVRTPVLLATPSAL